MRIYFLHILYIRFSNFNLSCIKCIFVICVVFIISDTRINPPLSVLFFIRLINGTFNLILSMFHYSIPVLLLNMLFQFISMEVPLVVAFRF